jgi:hypothetical protein
MGLDVRRSHPIIPGRIGAIEMQVRGRAQNSVGLPLVLSHRVGRQGDFEDTRQRIHEIADR